MIQVQKHREAFFYVHFHVLLHLTGEDIIFQSIQDIVKFIYQETKHISSRERFFLTSLMSTVQ